MITKFFKKQDKNSMYWLQIEVSRFSNIPKKDRLFIRWNSNTVYDRSNFDKYEKLYEKEKKRC